MKYKIASINLIISEFIAISFLLFAYYVWFPHSIAELNGFSKSALLLVCTNLILGPLLILFFYKKNKKNLKFDLYALTLIQTTALLFGMYSIYQKHPVYAVFTIDRFTLVNAQSAEPEKIIHDELKTPYLSRYKMAFAQMPTDLKLRNEIVFGHMLNDEPDLDGRAEYYEPYSNHIESVINKSLNLRNLSDVVDRKKFDLFFEKHGGTIESYAYIPLQTHKDDVIWVLNKETAKPIGIINVDPWQFYQKMIKKPVLKNKTKRWLS